MDSEVKEVKEVTTETKKPEKKSWGQNLLYPLNHALSCLFTDTFIQPFAGAWAQAKIESNKLPRWIGSIIETPDAKKSGTVEQAKQTSSMKHNIKFWFGGEVIGDLGAVPLTATVHRFLPFVTTGVRKLAEPVAGRMFKGGAERSSIKWAKERGLDPQGTEAQARKKELYEYEVNHLGDVVTWNVMSAVVGVEAQKKLGNHAPRKTLYAGKIFSAIISNTMLLSARGSAPHVFQKMEDKVAHTSRRLIGIDKDKSHDRHQNKDATPQKNWANGVEQNTASPQVASR